MCPTTKLSPTRKLIDGNGYPDDYQVVRRGLSIGRIMKGTGSPMHAPQWWWECTIPAQPSPRVRRGPGSDLDDCQAKFGLPWAGIRGGITEDDISEAHRYAEGHQGSARQIWPDTEK